MNKFSYTFDDLLPYLKPTKNSEFIVENIVDKHISNFIKDGKYLCNQFGVCVKNY